ncbi:MAG: hypothetical protein CEE38_21300 [Planctomycetes bacterium B3_Pla]|nr:MAG: hypothetical protein CEE38_21300 [Planctomycetes bacterium B3_Pla]
MAIHVEQQIFDCIEKQGSFILDAGAGSGKTWTLVQTLNYLIETKSKELKNKNQQIVCITYTNVAKDEIIERTEHNDLVKVRTIHDFLWECIKQFQKELRIKLIELVEEKLVKINVERDAKTRTDTKIYKELSDKKNKYEEAIGRLRTEELKISYENFPRYSEGKLSHDELIIIAEKIFSSYPKIRKIITDLYPIILVDEYQDTQKETIQILLNYLLECEDFIVGFFGDKLQQIYDKGIGEIPSEFGLVLIQKTENYRSSKEVIGLLNKLRSDIEQYQPPQNRRTGRIAFYYFPNPNGFNANDFIQSNLKDKWPIESIENVKVLYLTHRFIAKEKQYEDLLQHYIDVNKRDCLIKNEDNRGWCPFADFLFDLESLVDLYINKRIQQLLRNVFIKIDSFDSKKQLKDLMEQMVQIRETAKIGDIINFTLMNQLLPESDGMKNYDFEDKEKQEFYDQLMKLEYAQFLRLYQVQQENTPFSTKHNTKGDEFDNVLVIIDDSAWRQNYNFNDYFSNNMEKEKRYQRTNNLFYVVCSRAKENLAVVCTSDLASGAKTQIQEWFGEGNYIEGN